MNPTDKLLKAITDVAQSPDAPQEMKEVATTLLDILNEGTFPERVARELVAARAKFPKPDGLLAALMEEVGEVSKAMLDESWPRVVEECVQVAAMAQRLAEESDPIFLDLRWQRIHKQ